MYKGVLKEILSYLFAIVGFFLLGPLFFVIICALSFFNEGSPFFFQTRIGKNEKEFKIIKFKTMNDKKDRNGFLLPDVKRMTRFGSFIRKTSLDEIPQLINVLKGDMSLIGPRPLLAEYLPLYNNFQKRRHEVKPGITGWAQVNGRNQISWEEKFKLDVWYVDHISFLLDLRILMLTIKKVFRSEGISEKDNVTMSKFEGNL